MITATDRVKKCLAHVEQCKAWAELTDRAVAKEEFRKLAAEWDALAGEIAEINKIKSAGGFDLRQKHP